jgi:RNA polymerase sigma-70 factor (ECF subfamily)
VTDQGEHCDHELMRRCREGDQAAFAALVRRWEGPTARVLARLADNHADVEDLCQETFLRVYRARQRYRADAAFSTWLYRIALNVARDYWRRRRRPQRAKPPPPAPAPPDVAGREELNGHVQAALAALPGRLREVLVLRHFGRLSFQEVADATGQRPSTVKSRAYRALRALRDELRRRGIQPEDLAS